MFKIRNLFFPRNTFTLDILSDIKTKGEISAMDAWRNTDKGHNPPRTSVSKVVNSLLRLESRGYISHDLKALQHPFSIHSGTKTKFYKITPEGEALLLEMRPAVNVFNEQEHQLNKIRKDS